MKFIKNRFEPDYNAHFQYRQYLTAFTVLGYIWIYLLYNLFSFLCKFKPMRKLLLFLSYLIHLPFLVSVFTSDGPPISSRIIVGATKSTYLPTTSSSEPNKEAIIRCKFNHQEEAKYGIYRCNAVFMVSAALCLLSHRDQYIETKGGGIFPPEYIFGKEYINETENRGLNIDILVPYDEEED
eukprot:TRINITY_DN2334_c0_g2_i1.p1 TRINITY_DN2334_c0_g2~~TRINITY_DN2334_c0_g2_i1.p1  ORF type:complete len:182 (-),score=46.89 TRINITY_DN2334_c0_g2_i1:24-569(-)